MNLFPRAIGIAFGGAMLLLTSGCNTVSVQSKEYLGLPNYPPSNPDSIQIVYQPPNVPHVRVGEITVEPQGNPTTQEIEQKIRAAAAPMGANAVVIVMDRTMLLGATVVGGPWWGGASVVPNTGRVIIGVAVRFNP